ncbi:MAG TPA: GNAT family N-acetyltransferase [Gemmatimonadales bacterium]|nr:GNAT family N-acetyltransferase [Gemmatimonadales bacterium]
MGLALRLQTDAAPALAPLPGLAFGASRDAEDYAAIRGRPLDDLATRLDAGHEPWVAYVDGVPAAFGWVATRSATLGELDLSVLLPRDAQYLWNFVTAPGFRGRGLYPRLLDAIVRAAPWEVTHSWVAFAPENHASAKGVATAGFRRVADLSRDAHGAPALYERLAGAGSLAAAMLGVPLVTDPLAPCWRCGRVMPETSACRRTGACQCDYQHPDRGCASAHRAA